VTEADGREEILGFESRGTDADGKPIISAGIGSSDGKLSPEGAEFAAILVGSAHEAEVARLIGE